MTAGGQFGHGRLRKQTAAADDDELIGGLRDLADHVAGDQHAAAARGRTVLISSHLISEVAQTADHLVVIGQGRLLAQTTVAELSARGHSLEEAFFQLTDHITEYASTYLPEGKLRSVS